MRPYTRSLDPADYDFLKSYSDPIRAFAADMQRRGIPCREYHEHRIWEYSSVMQQLNELNVSETAQVVDLGAGASFFDPYCALQFPNLCEVDSEKYGDHSLMVRAQRAAYGVGLPLFNCLLEDLSIFDSEIFDATLCISTIEHVDDHDAAFNEMVRITKPGGYLFITSDYFRDFVQFECSPSRGVQVTAYTKEFVLRLPERFTVDFVGATDLDYRGDFVHNYSFCNICLRKR